MSRQTSATQRLFGRFAVDTRALAVVRVALATIVIVEWFIDGRPDGLTSLVDVARWVLLPLALIHLAGVRTRLSSVLMWVAYGIPVRADLLTPGVEVHLGRYCIVLLLFWLMFLPVGEHLSWEARGRSQPRTILSVASGGLLLQFFIIYFWAGATKNISEWLVQRTALYDVLSNPEHGSELGRRMLDFPALLAAGSVATMAIEVLGSLLLFLPYRGIAGRRVFLVAAFVAFHIGMAAFMTLQFFPYVMMVGWLVFLPSSFLDRLTRTKAKQESDPSPVRNTLAGVAFAYVFVSSLVTWLYYPADEGWQGVVQEVGRHVLLYQQWAMFSVPSSL